MHYITATFGLGCFWSPDAVFGSIPGVIRTRVGYAGGKAENPTYEEIGDHTETIQIECDASLCSYEQLLSVFFDQHDVGRPPYSRQYMSLILTHDAEQEKAVENAVKQWRKHIQGDVLTEIQTFSTFTRAEDYHQKYALRRRSEIFTTIRKHFVDERAFIDDTLVARLNGLAGGYIHESDWAIELAKLDLDDAAKHTIAILTKQARAIL